MKLVRVCMFIVLAAGLATLQGGSGESQAATDKVATARYQGGEGRGRPERRLRSPAGLVEAGSGPQGWLDLG